MKETQGQQTHEDAKAATFSHKENLRNAYLLTQKPVSHDCSKETMNLMRKDHRSEGKRKGCFFSCVKPHPLDLQRKKRKPTPLEPEGGNT